MAGCILEELEHPLSDDEIELSLEEGSWFGNKFSFTDDLCSNFSFPFDSKYWSDWGTVWHALEWLDL